MLCNNKNVIDLLCKLNYEKMKINNLLFKQELIEKVMNPERLKKIYNDYNVKLKFWHFIDLYG
jgi:hypothetical protein